MMRTKLLIAAAALLLVLAGCKLEVTLEAPENLHWVSVSSDGGSLTIAWDEVTDAEGYRIYADDELVDEVATPQATVDQPCAIIKVVPYKGDDQGDAATLNVAPVEGSITIYERSAEGPSALGWDAQGNAASYSVTDTAHFLDFDLYIDDFTAGETNAAEIHWVSPSYNHFGDAFNDTATGFKQAPSTDFDGEQIADAPGTGYEAPYSSFYLEEGQVYFVWVDIEPCGSVNDGDYFAKLKVKAISPDGEVQLAYAFQPVSGLRWLVTE